MTRALGVIAPAGAAGASAGAAPRRSDPLGVVEIPAGEPIHIAFWGVLSGADASLGEDWLKRASRSPSTTWAASCSVTTSS